MKRELFIPLDSLAILEVSQTTKLEHTVPRLSSLLAPTASLGVSPSTPGFIRLEGLTGLTESYCNYSSVVLQGQDAYGNQTKEVIYRAESWRALNGKLLFSSLCEVKTHYLPVLKCEADMCSSVLSVYWYFIT